VQLLVSAATEALRLAGAGRGARGAAAAPPPPPPGPSRPLRAGDVAGVLRAIRADYRDRAYFVTGAISDAIYDEDCYFADPTISFTGRELWKRNLALLVPFLEDPSIELHSLRRVPGEGRGAGAVLLAAWTLRSGLRLPWRPFVEVEGTTEYTLAWPGNNRVVRHVEGWDIDGLQALALVFTPGGGRR
jgi:hypothetical protein